MSWILLTNDDGIDSPALAPFAAALADLGTVRVVVPDRERSWIGKAITRFDPIRVEKVELDGGAAWTCTGFPADAVQIGIHGLFDEPPSLVVSGINVGYNHGAAFLMSSGTVGAAVEGWVSGIPSIAVSTGGNGDWSTWKRKVHQREALFQWERLAIVATSLVDEAHGSGLFELADVVTINLPFDTTLDTPRRVTTVARVGYDRLFRDQGDGIYTHDFGGRFVEFEGIDGTDIAAAREGVVSITPLRMPAASAIPDEVRSRLER
ncbi:MAG: 5'/3'-nucleotidase SurE [Actinomycetota bacterium]|nr:5'/3'-nucleotidase SurE [Actinomycetota bacterium]